jgi:signal transduction histidine kinase
MTLAFWKPVLTRIAEIGMMSDDDDEMRLKKAILVVTSVLIGIAGVIWGLLYLAMSHPLAASIPLTYSTLTALNLLRLSGHQHRFNNFRTVQILMTLQLPFWLMLVLGGYITGSVVIVWSFLAPLGALLCWDQRRATLWFAAFIALLVVAGLLTPLLHPNSTLSIGAIIAFYVINVGTVALVAFVVLIYFFKQKELALQLMQRNRELERANMEQEILLRESEKMATLGRLSAGIAHELNNPAAAAQRGAAQLKSALSQLEQSRFALGHMNLTETQQNILNRFVNIAQERTASGTALDPMKRSDREYAIEAQLEENGFENAWEYAPLLVDLLYETNDVAELSGIFASDQFSTVISSLTSSHTAQSLLDEISHGAGRIAEIVQALKTYTYLDQAPIQFLNIHEGLDNTLVMLRNKLKNGVEVQRDYAEDLPRVQGYGSELNQVWTNIIDNAVDAMNGSGVLHLCTRRQGTQVIIEITDNGPGIPPDIMPKIFDPFFTTKPIGKGTGLGLNTSQNIIVKKHHGEISVRSQPGETTFTIKLPLELPSSS